MNTQQQNEEHIGSRIVGLRNSRLGGFAVDSTTGHLYPVLERTPIQPRHMQDGSDHMAPSDDVSLSVGRMMVLGGTRILIYGTT